MKLFSFWLYSSLIIRFFRLFADLNQTIEAQLFLLQPSDGLTRVCPQQACRIQIEISVPSGLA